MVLMLLAVQLVKHGYSCGICFVRVRVALPSPGCSALVGDDVRCGVSSATGQYSD